MYRIAGHPGGMQAARVYLFFLLVLVPGGKHVPGSEDNGSLCFIYGCWNAVATNVTVQLIFQKKLCHFGSCSAEALVRLKAILCR